MYNLRGLVEVSVVALAGGNAGFIYPLRFIIPLAFTNPRAIDGKIIHHFTLVLILV